MKYWRKLIISCTAYHAVIQLVTLKNEECLISHFISEHNYDLQGSNQWYYVDLCSKILEADSLIQPIRKIETAKEAEVRARARFCDMSYGKHLRA